MNRDIDALYKWATANIIKFHPKKCKVLSVSLKRPKYYILPFDRFSYELDNDIIEYVTEQIDLGVTLTNRMTWERHQDNIITKANRQLGMTKRTCHFVKNIAQKRSLYIAIVRILFEHCGEIWGPNVVTTINKFEPIQKKAVKWILVGGNKKYNEQEYQSKLHKLELLPMHYFFAVKKLKLFHNYS